MIKYDKYHEHLVYNVGKINIKWVFLFRFIWFYVVIACILIHLLQMYMYIILKINSTSFCLVLAELNFNSYKSKLNMMYELKCKHRETGRSGLITKVWSLIRLLSVWDLTKVLSLFEFQYLSFQLEDSFLN